MKSFGILFVLVLCAVGCQKGVSNEELEGKYIRTTHSNPTFGWERLEFRPNGVLVINDGEFTSTYKVSRKGSVQMHAGIMEVMGEILGDKLLINQEVFAKQKD